MEIIELSNVVEKNLVGRVEIQGAFAFGNEKLKEVVYSEKFDSESNRQSALRESVTKVSESHSTFTMTETASCAPSLSFLAHTWALFAG